MIIRGTSIGMTGGAITTPSSNPHKTIGITLVHGLISGDGCWSDKMREWGNANGSADWSSLAYWEGVFGFGHAGNRKKLIKLLHDELAKFPESQQHAVGHSNGCRLLLETLMADRSIRLDDLHLIAAWAPRDCRQHINEILSRRYDDGTPQVRRIFLYTSTSDDALGWNALNPFTFDYRLGKDGPLYPDPVPDICPFDYDLHDAASPFTQIFDNTRTHCSWVDGENGFSERMARKIMAISLDDAA